MPTAILKMYAGMIASHGDMKIELCSMIVIEWSSTHIDMRITKAHMDILFLITWGTAHPSYTIPASWNHSAPLPVQAWVPQSHAGTRCIDVKALRHLALESLEIARLCALLQNPYVSKMPCLTVCCGPISKS